MPSSFLSSLIHAGRNPVGVGANYVPFPKVGELRQPWADFHNPFGVDAPVSTRLSARQRPFLSAGQHQRCCGHFTTVIAEIEGDSAGGLICRGAANALG